MTNSGYLAIAIDVRLGRVRAGVALRRRAVQLQIVAGQAGGREIALERIAAVGPLDALPACHGWGRLIDVVDDETVQARCSGSP